MARRLLVALVLLLPLGYAVGQTGEYTLTCQLAGVRWSGLCMLERPVFDLGPWSVTVGVEGRVSEADGISLSGYGVVWWQYNDRTAFWGELRLPRVAPIIGTSDVFRLGFTTKFGGSQ